MCAHCANQCIHCTLSERAMRTQRMKTVSQIYTRPTGEHLSCRDWSRTEQMSQDAADVTGQASEEVRLEAAQEGTGRDWTGRYGTGHEVRTVQLEESQYSSVLLQCCCSLNSSPWRHRWLHQWLLEGEQYFICKIFECDYEQHSTWNKYRIQYVAMIHTHTHTYTHSKYWGAAHVEAAHSRWNKRLPETSFILYTDELYFCTFASYAEYRDSSSRIPLHTNISLI